jgi:hypothetical protein
MSAVPTRFSDWVGDHMVAHPGFWKRLGNIESWFLADDIADTEIRSPIYVCGLARAGTTAVLEALACANGVTSHHYSDFPYVFTPYWRNKVHDLTPGKSLTALERSHRDGISVNANSPEAIEEALWMAFFDHLHDPQQNNVLAGTTENAAFEAFYKDHIRKLLLVRGAGRYLAKGNYNIARMEYLLKIFPDARFVVVIRDPVEHVASLMRQDTLFQEIEKANPLALKHMRKIGHFEFGLDIRLLNFGNGCERIHDLWQKGDAARGWAVYWSNVYRYVANRLEQNRPLADATHVIRHRDLCDDAQGTIDRASAHCQLEPGSIALAGKPRSYEPSLGEKEISAIRGETDEVAGMFSL